MDLKCVQSTSILDFPAYNHFFLCSYRPTEASGLRSQVQLNVEVLCQELTTNIMKLEKVTYFFSVFGGQCVAPLIAAAQGNWRRMRRKSHCPNLPAGHILDKIKINFHREMGWRARNNRGGRRLSCMWLT